MNVTKDGVCHIKRWKYAAQEVEHLKRKINKATCELVNAETELARWLRPKDAKSAETFCVWYGDSLITAKSENGHESIELRTRGKSWDDL